MIKFFLQFQNGSVQLLQEKCQQAFIILSKQPPLRFEAGMRLFFHPLVARAEFSDRSWSSKGAFVDAAADEVVASSPVATAHIHRRSRKRKPRLLCRRCARSFGVPSILVISMYAYLIWITEIIDFCTLIQTTIYLEKTQLLLAKMI